MPLVDTLTIEKIRSAIGQATPAWVAENAAFDAGDHWQGGLGWTGPQPRVGEVGYSDVMLEIARAFCATNAIAEVLDRHVAGVVGKEPRWGLTVRRPLKQGKKPMRAEQTLIDEAEALLTSWWDERGLHQLLQRAARAALIGGRAPVRLFVPSGERDESGAVPVAPLAASLSRIYAELLPLETAAHLTDRETMRKAGVYLSGQGRDERAEITFVDPASGETVIRVLGAGEVAEYRYAAIGHPLHYQAERPALITAPVRSGQKQLNLARTMKGRNVVQGGFLERIVLNAQLPGSYVEDLTAPSGRRFVPGPLRVGAGTTNFLSGLPLYDDQGGIRGYASPSVVYRDPASVEPFAVTERDAYAGILGECHQRHALIAGDAAASGEARLQARADYLADLRLTQPALERLLRWLLEAALNLAAVLSGQPGRYAALRADVTCRVDAGPLSADEQRLILERVAAGLLSTETAMALLGIDDVDAELARIAAERDTPAPAPEPTPEPDGTDAGQGPAQE